MTQIQVHQNDLQNRCEPEGLAEGIHPRSIIIDQDLRTRDLIGCHPVDNLFQTDGGVGISANCRQRVPKVGANQIGGGHAAPDLVVPADAGLRAGVPLERGPQIPFKGAFVIALDAEAKRIHDADQFLGIGIAGAGQRQKGLHRVFELPVFHKIAGLFQSLRLGKRRGEAKYKGKKRAAHVAGLLLWGSVAFADLPAPMSDKDFLQFDMEQARLGQLLFYDPILSGNRNIACATCHHPKFGTGDGLSLGIGEGGQGLGPDRVPGTGSARIRKRIPRNAPALWNLGAKEFTVFFHDGRATALDTYDNSFDTPAEEWLPDGLDSLLAAQAIFPLTAQFEMAGNPGENQVTGAVHDRIDGAWPILAKRVRTIPEYGERLQKAFDLNGPEEAAIEHIANALAAFMKLEFRSTDSPFDAALRGETGALDVHQARGMDLFYGKAGCSSCHSGALLTDHDFHAIGIPGFGPGRTRRFDPMPRDVGRMGESDLLEDMYRFRTPSLRNVALTAPYGHNGAYPTLEGIVRHHLDVHGMRAVWTPAMAQLPDVPWLVGVDFAIREDRFEMAREAAALDIVPRDLTDDEIADVIAFLHALTGRSARVGVLGIPDAVPSGLPVAGQ